MRSNVQSNLYLKPKAQQLEASLAQRSGRADFHDSGKGSSRSYGAGPVADNFVSPRRAAEALLSVLDVNSLIQFAKTLRKLGYLKDVPLNELEPAILQEENKTNLQSPSLPGGQFFKHNMKKETWADVSEDYWNQAHEMTLLIRNLPPEYDKVATIEWLDAARYKDSYDFLFWFPSKRSSRIKSSNCFVNFVSVDFAQQFKEEFHNHRLVQNTGFKTPALNISVAKIQGFEENFMRYWHLGDGGLKHHSDSTPYFAERRLALMSPEQMDEAKTCARKDEAHPAEYTTVVIRNLPTSVKDQDDAIRWLSDHGHGQDYDFLLYVPPRKMTSLESFAYVFVNYLSVDLAKACIEGLDGISTQGRETELSVVPARIQGRETCETHFQKLAETGRLVPWTCTQRPNRDFIGSCDSELLPRCRETSSWVLP